MKASDVMQLLIYAARNSDYFSNKYSITNFQSLGSGNYRVTTSAPHMLKVNDSVALTGLKSPTPIASHTTNVTDTLFDTHNIDHDLTKAKNETKSVTIFDNFGYSQSFNLKSVPNRYEFYIDGTPSLPANPLFLAQQYEFGYNGTQTVTAVTSTTFDFHSDTYLSAPIYSQNYSSAFVKGQFRIGGAIDVETIRDSYTEQPPSSCWLFVVLGTNDANKSRNNENDAFITQGRQADYYSLIIANFHIFAVVPDLGNTLTDISGRSTRDFVEQVVRPFVFKAVLGAGLPTYLSTGTQSAVSYAGDKYYSWNGAYYIHQFDFQQIMNITNADTSVQESSRAFRDLDLELFNSFGVNVGTATINIDEEPYT